MPVRQFERRINGSGSTQRFLCRNGSFQDKTSVEFIVSGERVHELGRFLYQMVILLDNFIGRIGTIHQFRQIDKVRLLPNKETAYIGRSLYTARIGHLHPTDTVEALATGYFAGNGLYGLIPAQCTVKQFGMSPKSLPGLMPPNHFQMELAKPGVVSQTRFLRRRSSGRLDGKQILAQQDTAFQFRSTRIRTMREIDSRTVFPESGPIAVTCGSGFSIRGQRLVTGVNARFALEHSSFKVCRETAGQGEHIFFRSQHEIVL